MQQLKLQHILIYWYQTRWGEIEVEEEEHIQDLLEVQAVIVAHRYLVILVLADMTSLSTSS